MEVGVGERARVARLADPVIGDLVAEAVARRAGRRSCTRCSACRRRTTWRTAGPTRASCVNGSSQSSRSRASRAQNSTRVCLGLGIESGLGVGLGGEGGVRRERAVLGQEVLDLGRLGRVDAHGPSALTDPLLTGLARWPGHPTGSRPCPGHGSAAGSSWLARIRRPGVVDLDRRSRERGDQALAVLAGRRPLVRGADRAEDLQGHARVRRSLRPARREAARGSASASGGVGLHRLAHIVDDLDRPSMSVP